MSRLRDHDLVVIGGGAGGLSVARAARRRGARALLVHAGPIGGDCTFTGCVPSKTLIEAAHRQVPFPDAIARVHATVERIAATETPDALGSEGIETLAGHASFRSASTLDVDGTTVTAPKIVIATGARAAIPPIPGLDTVPYLTNEAVFTISKQPESLVVLGGGAIGCELAQAFTRFGTRVTVIEGLDRLLPKEEPEASAVIAERFAREGVTVHTGHRVQAVATVLDGISLTLDDGTTITTAELLVAVGRNANTEGLEVARAGVTLDDRGFVRTDDHLATTTKGIWAVGDVTGRLQFTHAADAMGRVAATNALALSRPRFSIRPIPWATFTDPEVAHVGTTEADAPAGARVAYQPMSAVDRAITADEADGFVKLIAGPHPITRNVAGGRILGATIVAARAGELIHEPALAMQTGMFTGRLAQLPHAYPTWSVAIQQAAAQFFLELDGRTARPVRSGPQS